MTKEAAEKEASAVKGRITYSLNLEDLKDVDLVVEVRTLTMAWKAINKCFLLNYKGV